MIVSLVWGKEAVMGSLLERLEQREAAAQERAEALRAEIDKLAERLAAEEALLERLVITRQTVIELLAGDDLDEDVAATAGAGTTSAVGMVVQVPAFSPDGGGDGDGRGLPVAYRDVVEVLADAGVALRAMQVCQALGLGTEPRHREGMRSKLKRLVGRGWLVEVSPGLLSCASGVAGALDGGDGDPAGDPEQVKMKGRGSSS